MVTLGREGDLRKFFCRLVVDKGTAAFFAMASGPSNEAIVEELHKILDEEDLEKLTRKDVLEKLQQTFHVDLTDRRQFIKQKLAEIVDAKDRDEEEEEEEEEPEPEEKVRRSPACLSIISRLTMFCSAQEEESQGA